MHPPCQLFGLSSTHWLSASKSQKYPTYLPCEPVVKPKELPCRDMTKSTAKSLGVHIDQNLSWECHIQSICKKIASALGAVKRIRHLIPFNVLINVYDSLIQPHFDYCNVVWTNCGIGLSDKLQRLQNRAARILMSANSDCNVDDLFLALGWRKLKTPKTSIDGYYDV